MKFPRSIKGWDEQDAYTGWRRVMFWQTGELKKTKRRTHKRERREGIQHIRRETNNHE